MDAIDARLVLTFERLPACYHLVHDEPNAKMSVLASISPSNCSGAMYWTRAENRSCRGQPGRERRRVVGVNAWPAYSRRGRNRAAAPLTVSG